MSRYVPYMLATPLTLSDRENNVEILDEEHLAAGPGRRSHHRQPTRRLPAPGARQGPHEADERPALHAAPQRLLRRRRPRAEDAHGRDPRRLWHASKKVPRLRPRFGHDCG